MFTKSGNDKFRSGFGMNLLATDSTDLNGLNADYFMIIFVKVLNFDKDASIQK